MPTNLDNDKLTYSLKAREENDAARAQAALFGIDPSTGQIRTKKLLNHESAVNNETSPCVYDDLSADPPTCTYTVVVEVRDGLNEHRVPDKDEAADDYCHRDDPSAGRRRTSGRADGDSDGSRDGCGYYP